MGRWTATVYETLTRMVRYEVEADNVSEAAEKILSGETVDETIILGSEVIGRVRTDGISPITE